MKKTIPTTLSGTLFYIEEDAYTRLSSYLETIKSHFASFKDSSEIISDIENRIAEQFLENGNKDKIVTLKNIEDLIMSMGNVEDFNDTDEKERIKTTDADVKKKKLFRNPDDVVIAGVASGLAAYFGIDPIIVRLLFVLVVLMGGSGVLIYIILWLIMPMAHSSTEKLQMRGEPVTLESVNEIVREKVNEVKANKGTFRKIIGFPFVIIGLILRKVLPILQKILGIVLILASSIVTGILGFVLIITLFNIKSPYVDFPLNNLGHPILIYIGLLAGFFVLFFPTLFILLFGVKITNKKKVFRVGTVVTLSVLWFVSVTTLGAIASRLAPEYQNFIETSPLYTETTKDFDVKDFSRVDISNGNNVNITEGKTFKVTAVGKLQGMENLSVNVKNGTLYIERDRHFKICIFCFGNTPQVNITMPKIENIKASNGSDVTAIATSTGDLVVKLQNGSYAKLLINTKNFNLEESNASFALVSGTTTASTIKLSNGSRIKAIDLFSTDTIITEQNGSTGEIFVGKTLNVKLQNGSYLLYKGEPVITEQISNGSRVKKMDDSADEMVEEWY
jgi:phage shock protein PspC (stress-responsive transcriptional regulator)